MRRHEDILDQRSKKWVKQETQELWIVGVPYLHGSGDEGDLRSWVQVLVDDESAGPLTRPHDTAALDQHQELRRVGQGVRAQVDKTGGLIQRSLQLDVQENKCVSDPKTPQISSGRNSPSFQQNISVSYNNQTATLHSKRHLMIMIKPPLVLDSVLISYTSSIIMIEKKTPFVRLKTEAGRKTDRKGD